MHERIAPALADDRCPAAAEAEVHHVLHEVVGRFQTAEAVRFLLDEPFEADGLNSPGHPLRVLGDPAVTILPELGTVPQRRVKIFTAAVH